MKQTLLAILVISALSTIGCNKIASFLGKQSSEKMKPEQAQSGGPSEALTSEEMAAGYVRLYDGKRYTDRILTVPFGKNIEKMSAVKSDDGTSDFNDKTSAAKYFIPEGWRVSLFENDDFDKRAIVLKGSGAIGDFSYFSDQCSSLRWEKQEAPKQAETPK